MNAGALSPLEFGRVECTKVKTSKIDLLHCDQSVHFLEYHVVITPYLHQLWS